MDNSKSRIARQSGNASNSIGASNSRNISRKPGKEANSSRDVNVKTEKDTQISGMIATAEMPERVGKPSTARMIETAYTPATAGKLKTTRLPATARMQAKSGTQYQGY
jgi:hypothetical protein